MNNSDNNSNNTNNNAALGTTLIILGGIAWLCLLALLPFAVDSYKSTVQEQQYVSEWEQWKTLLRQPAMVAKRQYADDALMTVQRVVADTVPGANAVLVGSYKSGSFQPEFSDVDIKVTVPGSQVPSQLVQALTEAGFPFVHAAPKYHLFTKKAQDGHPPVDVSVSPATAPDKIHCASMDPVGLEAQGFLLHLIRSEYPLHHVTVRQWQPKTVSGP